MASLLLATLAWIPGPASAQEPSQYPCWTEGQAQHCEATLGTCRIEADHYPGQDREEVTLRCSFPNYTTCFWLISLDKSSIKQGNFYDHYCYRWTP